MSEHPRRKNITVFIDGGAHHKHSHVSTLVDLGVTLTITHDPVELSELIRLRSADVLVLFHDTGVSRDIEECLQKSRNFSQARTLRILSVAQHLTPMDIDRLLRMGVLWIYLDPVKPDVWLNEIRHLLGTSTSVNNWTHLLRVNPVDIYLRVFGRVGKAHAIPTGALSIETALIPRPGEVLSVCGALQEEFSPRPLTYQVTQVNQENLYFRYGGKLEVQPQEPMEASQWSTWLRAKREDWIAPKTKVLWVSRHYGMDQELIFEKELFSIYHERPEELRPDVLDRLSPRIIVLENLLGDTEFTVDAWVKTHPPDTVMVFSSGLSGPNTWKKCGKFGADDFAAAHRSEIRGFVMSRIGQASREARFISRRSPLSKMYFKVDAKLTEISDRGFAMLSPFDFRMPSAVQIEFKSPDLQSPTVIFGRVAASEFLSDRLKYRVFCEWLPHSDRLERVVPQYRQILGK